MSSRDGLLSTAFHIRLRPASRNILQVSATAFSWPSACSLSMSNTSSDTIISNNSGVFRAACIVGWPGVRRERIGRLQAKGKVEEMQVPRGIVLPPKLLSG